MISFEAAAVTTVVFGLVVILVALVGLVVWCRIFAADGEDA